MFQGLLVGLIGDPARAKAAREASALIKAMSKEAETQQPFLACHVGVFDHTVGDVLTVIVSAISGDFVISSHRSLRKIEFCRHCTFSLFLASLKKKM